MRVGGKERDAVAWRDEETPPHDHVAVAVAVRGGAERGRVRSVHFPDQHIGVREVRVGMMSAEIGKRRRVDDRAVGCAEPLLQNLLGVGAGDRAHRVEANAITLLQPRSNAVEVEERLHKVGVVGDGVHNLHPHPLDPRLAGSVEVDVRNVGDAVLAKLTTPAEDGVGDVFGGRPAVGDVVFDAEIAVRAAGIVASRQDDSAARLAQSDEMRRGGSREDACPSHDHAPVAVGSRHLQDHLDRFAIVVAAVTSEHEHRPGAGTDGIEQRLDIVLEVARLLEDLDLLPQPRGAGLLIAERCRRDGPNVHPLLPGTRRRRSTCGNVTANLRRCNLSPSFAAKPSAAGARSSAPPDTSKQRPTRAHVSSPATFPDTQHLRL